MVLTEVPEDYFGRQIGPARRAHGFAISLDRAEPWGGGRIAGRVERGGPKRDIRPITVIARCEASWRDLPAPKPLARLGAWGQLPGSGAPVWLDETVWTAAHAVGDLGAANWLPFAFEFPPTLPRAFEGTYVAFRWRVEARRPRLVGHSEASLPLIIREEQTIPTVRIETSPNGTRRLVTWRSEAERTSHGVPCAVRYEERRVEDAPAPGQT